VVKSLSANSLSLKLRVGFKAETSCLRLELAERGASYGLATPSAQLSSQYGSQFGSPTLIY
jgi:hypothetical protein